MSEKRVHRIIMIKQTVKMNGCFFQQLLRRNLSWFSSQHSKMLFLRISILKPTERVQVLLKTGSRGFQNSPPFERSTCFCVTISESFKRFQYFNFETKFSGKQKPFSKNWSTVFQLKPLRLKTHYFLSKLLCQMPMLRQIEWRLKNGPITKSGVLNVTTLFSWKICSSSRTS